MSPQSDREEDFRHATRQEFVGSPVGESMEVLSQKRRDSTDMGAPTTGANPRHWAGLGRILWFFGIIVVLAFAMNALINAGLRRIRTSNFGVSNQVMEGRVNAEIVISGSSRALYHYDTRSIQEITRCTTFNVGLNGSHTDMQLAFLKAYLDHNAKPKLVIQNLDLFCFEPLPEIYDPAQYMPYLDEDPIYHGVLRYYPDAWKWKYLPLYDYLVQDMRFQWLLGLRALVGWQPKEDRFQGFIPRHSSWTDDFERFQRRYPNGTQFEIEPQGVRDLKELAEVCRQRRIPLLFVYSPEYVDMQALERNRSEIFALFRQICERYQAPLWDFSDSPISKDRANFYNSQHLNAEGARAFSEDLAHRLVASGLLPAKPASQ